MTLSQFCSLAWKTVSVAVLLCVLVLCICLTGCTTPNGASQVPPPGGLLFIGAALALILALGQNLAPSAVIRGESVFLFVDSHGMLFRVCSKEEHGAKNFGPMDYSVEVRHPRWGTHMTWQDMPGARLLPAGEDGWVWVALDDQ